MTGRCHPARQTASGRPLRFLKFAITAIALVAPAATSLHARDLQARDDQFPYSIMAPEPGTARHHRHVKAERNHDAEAPPSVRREPSPSLLGHEKFVAKLHRGARPAPHGSSGVVLPTALPKTQLIPPEGGGTFNPPPVSQAQGPTIVPGLRRPVPNLPHGPETFQDRASRCAFQSGLYNVPGNLRGRYVGGCVN